MKLENEEIKRHINKNRTSRDGLAHPGDVLTLPDGRKVTVIDHPAVGRKVHCRHEDGREVMVWPGDTPELSYYHWAGRDNYE